MALKKSRLSLPAFFCLLLSCLSVVSCSTVSKGPGGEITKVKYYQLQPMERVRGTDRTILFERDYHLRGAVTLEEQLERAGHYYAIFWKSDDRSQPVIVRLEYRQRNSGLAVKSIEQEVADVGRSNLTKFEVTGPEYQKDGPVSAWRVSIRRGKEELASQESFLWN